ncbi:hypothetical protein [Pseudorhodoplanes sinuspersici]|uniref:Uncharacterized protein n=1 Tax=Pseudorhodoplanes sinuspersici TaxID=1235591 RepID=A0A1W6ZU99_9HYPH|nr:hypothetical protein [Pseudorhodoplanes sinuspersici]ARQ00893.1 hypothetical protein CAK95_18700 [Pseudorhodoplanes sinuspersici]RKE72517.1 hypothetical protein DFP91_0384 [Pseudorhodoplanes sinuspersici]
MGNRLRSALHSVAGVVVLSRRLEAASRIFALHVSILLAIACGALIWLIGRRWFALAGLIVMALLIVLFEDVPDFPTDDKPDRKTARRLKLEQAIAKREALLRSKGP